MKSIDDKETTPIDDMISLVEQWIKHPDKINEQTLMSLKADLEDLKSTIDKEETDESDEYDMKEKKPSLMIMIGRLKKGEEK